MGAIPPLPGLLLALLIYEVVVSNSEGRGDDGYGEAAFVNLRHMGRRWEVLSSDGFRKMGQGGGWGRDGSRRGSSRYGPTPPAANLPGREKAPVGPPAPYARSHPVAPPPPIY